MSTHDNTLSNDPPLVFSTNIPSTARGSPTLPHIRTEENEHHTKVIAPYKKLPVEMTRIIFRLCVSKFRGTSPGPYNVGGSLSSRLRITQICAAWRRIAFDEPALWKVHINSNRRHLKLAAAWFHQASGSRLGLDINYPMGFKFLNDLPVCEIIIAPYCRRLMYLDFTVGEELLGMILSYPFDNLEKLSLEFYQKNHGNSEPFDIKFSIPPPSLRHVSITFEPWLIHETLLCGLPLKQLTKLELLGYIPAVDLVPVLIESTSLEKLTILSVSEHKIVDQIWVPCPFPYTSISLERLQHLNISFYGDVEDFLYMLKIPKLSSLRTSFITPSPQSEAFLQQLPNLLRLDIADRDHRGFIDEHILPSLPPLAEFSVWKRQFQRSTLIKIGNGDLLPSVERLEFAEDDIELVFDMLATRTSSAQADPERVSQIKYVQIYCDDEEKRSMYYPACENWRSKGIVVEIVNEQQFMLLLR